MSTAQLNAWQLRALPATDIDASPSLSTYTRTGVIGSPSQATETKGNKALDHLGRNAATLIEHLTSQ